MATDSSPTAVPRRRRRFGPLLVAVLVLGLVELIALGIWRTQPHWSAWWERFQEERRAAELVRLLGDPSDQVRRGARDQLVALGDVALPVVRSALRDPRDEARAAACSMFPAMVWTPDEAIPALVEATHDRSAVVRRVALRGLARASRRWKPPEIGPYRPELRSVLRVCLHDESPEVRAEAVELLIPLWFEAEAFHADLQALLDDSAPRVRVEAAYVLACITPPPANEPYLQRLVSEPGPHARRSFANQALSNVNIHGEPLTLDSLLGLLRTAPSQTRVGAIRELGTLVRRAEDAPARRRRARLVVPILVWLLIDEDTEARMWAAFALQRIHPTFGALAAPSALSVALDPRAGRFERIWAIVWLQRIGAIRRGSVFHDWLWRWVGD